VIASATKIKALVVYWTGLLKTAEKEQVLSDFPDIGQLPGQIKGLTGYADIPGPILVTM
jgi:hypothetical protein